MVVHAAEQQQDDALNEQEGLEGIVDGARKGADALLAGEGDDEGGRGEADHRPLDGGAGRVVRGKGRVELVEHHRAHARDRQQAELPRPDDKLPVAHDPAVPPRARLAPAAHDELDALVLQPRRQPAAPPLAEGGAAMEGVHVADHLAR